MANGENRLRLIARDQGAATWPSRTRVSSQQLGDNPKMKWGPPLRLPLDVHPGRGGLTLPIRVFMVSVDLPPLTPKFTSIRPPAEAQWRRANLLARLARGLASANAGHLTSM